MNTNMPPFDDPSDARLHAALRRLPDHRAPDTLVPNVLAAIRARELAVAAPMQSPWYRRPATTWPAGLRVGLGVLAAALLTLLGFAPHLLGLADEGSALRLSASQLWGKVDAILGALSALGSACLAVLRDSAGSPYVIGAAAVILFSYFALLGIGGAVWRTASEARQP